VSEQEDREKLLLQKPLAKIVARNFFRFQAGKFWPEKMRRRELVIFVAAQKFVALDCGHDAHGGVVARFGALHPAEATDANRAGQGNFVRERQKDFDG
jgi:hypothetical protein